MDIDLDQASVVIIGGNSPCEQILEILTGPEMQELSVDVLLVADPLEGTMGMEYARRMGVKTTTVYADVLSLPRPDLILKLKNDEALLSLLEQLDPRLTRILDLDEYESTAFLNFLESEREKIRIRHRIRTENLEPETVIQWFDRFAARVQSRARQENTHLKMEREGLLEMEKELSQIIQGSMIPTFIINNDHILTHWNRACEELTGHKAYNLVGTDRQWVPFRSVKRPTMADVIVGRMSEADVQKYYGDSWRKSGLIREAYEAEEFFPHLGEQGKWIFFTAAPIKSPDGEIIGAIETLKDITEDKKAREELALQDRELATLYENYRKSEEKYRSLFNNNPNPIFIIDKETLEILDINGRGETSYGYAKAELLGRPFLDICGREDEEVRTRLLSLNENDHILFAKKRHYRKNGEPFYVNVKVVSTRYSHREVLIASATDITESVEKEIQLIQAGKLATLGTMAAGMAHEINQPLNVIQICSDLIQKMIKKGVAIPDEDLMSIAADIAQNVDRAAGVIKHVRDFARQSEPNLKKLNLNDPINDVFKVLGHQLSVHSVELKLDLAGDLPDIRAEHNRLEQVFINLVTNAIDAMDEKEKQAGVSVKKILEITTGVDGGFVLAKVSDTGTGMSESVKKKIFEPFFTTKETGKGTGLGTSITLGIIKDYHGTIEIESREGEGSAFLIRFPVAAGEPAVTD